MTTAKNTKNFKVSEFTCHCGCDFNVIDQRVIDMCQTIREELGVAVKITSGCRCVNHNKKVGGVKGSYHTKGLAADLACSLGASKIFEACKKLQVAGKLPALEYGLLYRRKNIVHIDCGKKRKNMWEVRE